MTRLPRPEADHADDSFTFIEWASLILLLCVPAIIGMVRHPLWIDETFTLFPVPVESSSLRHFLQDFLNFPGSIRFTPLYVLLVAGWARLVPATELALRCLNLPFLVGIALLSKAFVSRLPIRSAAARWSALAFVALSPFYIYYSFDLRPYASLICFGGMIVLGLVLFEEGNPRGPWLITAGFCLAFLTQPPVILIAPVIGLAVLFLALRDLRTSLRLWTVPGIVGSLLTAITTFYYYVVRTSGGMEAWGGGGFLKNILFIGYEFAGFAGLGPTRAQLRTLAPPAGRESTVAPTHFFWLDWLPAILFALIWATALVIVGRALWVQRKSSVWVTPPIRWSAALSIVGITILSVFFYLFHYRFLSRHVSFLYLPFLYLLLGCAACANWTGRGRLIHALILFGFAISSARLLFTSAYMREDPRGMIRAWQTARAREGSVSLWAFYPAQSIVYYGCDENFPSLRNDSVVVCERIGPASYRERKVPDLASVNPGNAPIVSLETPSRDLWEKLLDSQRGKHVVLALNRGTEFDHEGLAREFLANPATHAVKLGEWPFVECFECVVP